MKLLTKQILVLGANVKAPGVTCSDWSPDEPDYSLPDFDLVIVNLASLPSEASPNQSAIRMPHESEVYQLLFRTEARLIVIGNPRKPTSVSSTDWLPWVPNTIPQHGRRIEAKPVFKYYFDAALSHWEFLFCGGSNDRCGYSSGLGERIFGREIAGIHCAPTPLAINNAGVAIGVALTYSIFFKPGLEIGVAHWLPPPTEITIEDAVQLLLENECPDQFGCEAPEWAARYSLPDEEPTIKEVSDLKRALNEVQSELSQSEADLEEKSRYKGLLHLSGHPLHTLVIEALRELGAQVPAKEDDYMADLAFTDPCDREYVGEVKGLERQTTKKDIRQLSEWVINAEHECEGTWEGKGLYIVNPMRLADPNDRVDQVHPECVRLAERHGYAIVLTEHLFQAICAKQRGEFDVTEFWNQVWNTTGLVPSQTGAVTSTEVRE